MCAGPGRPYLRAMTRTQPFRVVLAGGGIGAVETLLALRALAGERVHLTLVSPSTEMLYRPQTVAEPFDGPTAARYSLHRICEDLGAELVLDRLLSVEDGAHRVRLQLGGWLQYDALVIAVGAISEPAFEHAHTFLAEHWHDDIRGVAQSLESGYAQRVAFVAPPHAGWTLPLYELALLTAARAPGAKLTIVTPESTPLAAFRGLGGDAVQRLLADACIEVLTASYATEEGRGTLRVHPGGRALQVDRVVALPELRGPRVSGLPQDERGFIPVEHACRVRDHDAVFAIGDACDFPIKQGGLATQQADAAAETIAARAGADIPPARFRPILRAKLLTGADPLYLRADLAGGHTVGSVAASHCLWWPAEKVAGRYLAPYLAERELRPTGPIEHHIRPRTGRPPVVHNTAGDAGIELLGENA